MSDNMLENLLASDDGVRAVWFKKILDPANNCYNLRAFVYNMFGKKLHGNQFLPLRDMLDPNVKRIYYTSSRQSGKTEAIALFQAIFPIFPDFIIPHYEGIGNCYIFAPKQEQAQISFERFSNFVHFNDYNLFLGSFIIDKADRVKFGNGADIRAITASRNAEIEGLTTHIIILDESQAISPHKVNESILPMGGSIKGGAKIIQAGVPGITGSHFHKAFKDIYHPETNKLGYVHHIYPWQKCSRLSKDYVLSLKKDQDSFDRNYELIWAKSNFGYFTNNDEFDACSVEYSVLKKLEEAEKNGWPLHWGIDFAKHRDSTVITTWAEDNDGHMWLVGLIEIKGTDYTEQVGYIKNIYIPGRHIHCCADQTCVGEMPIESMVEGGIPTTGVMFNIKTKDQMYKNFRFMIQSKLVHWPTKKSPQTKDFKKNYKRFKQQLLELEVEYKSSGHILIHHNLEDSSARDDYPDSACLGVWSKEMYIEPNCEVY